MLETKKIAQAFSTLATALDTPQNQNQEILIQVALHSGASPILNFLGYPSLWSKPDDEG